jgi:hypothetical protein
VIVLLGRVTVEEDLTIPTTPVRGTEKVQKGVSPSAVSVRGRLVDTEFPKRFLLEIDSSDSSSHFSKLVLKSASGAGGVLAQRTSRPWV